MTKPTNNPVGRPPGSRDFRPFILKVLERHFCIDTVLTEWNKLRSKLLPREKLQFDLELMKLGVASSPKTVDVDGGTTISLIIGGIKQTLPIDGTDTPAIDVTPDPRALAAAPVDIKDSRNRTAGGKTEACDALRDLPKKTPAPEPPPVPKGPVFTVPNSDEVLGPPEWRGTLAQPKGDF